jgi:hypothetical protein
VTPLDLMKNSDAATIVSRYACLDFSQIYGFPNPLPKDEYFLRNGPKFSGDDLSLTLKHISNFRDFTEFLESSMKMFSLDCFMIHSKGSVRVGLKVFLLDLLELLQLFGLSFWKHGWRRQSLWQTLLPFKVL